MANFGNPTGPVYPLGKFTVNVGTPVALSNNIKVTDGFGTSTNPPPLKATNVKVATSNANTGNVFLIFTAQAAASSNGLSVILVVPPGAERELKSEQISAAFTVDRYGIDGDHSGDIAWVTVVNA